MKKFLNLSTILFVALAVTLGSCKKEEDQPTTTTPAPKTGVVTCKVDGKAWESNSRSTMVYFLDTTVNSVGAEVEADTMTMLAFRTQGTDSSVMMFTVLLKNPRTSTYTMTGTDYNIFYVNGLDLTSLLTTFFGYTASSSLTITKYDPTNNKISGTFNTTMTSTSTGPTITVTEGAFTDVYLKEN